jgi:CHAT domain
MMVRFVVRVTEQETGWTVELEGPGGKIATRDVLRLAEGVGDAMPQAPAVAGKKCELCGSTQVRALFDAYVSVKTKQAKRGELADFGRYLFEALVGSQPWLDVMAQSDGARHIELAVSFPQTAWELHRLPWEMMHDGDKYIAERTNPRVAITRLVPVSCANRESPLVVPLTERLLFVVGSPLGDERVQAAAEYMGVLRELNFRGVRLDVMPLLDASPRKLVEAVRRLRPSVVHIATHGEVRGTRGVLQFAADDAGGEDVFLDAEGLLEALRVDDGPLPIVVLSACDSGTPAHGGVPRPSTGAESLAVRLVAEGIPCVIGMSGAVANHACRLFAKSLYAGLYNGSGGSIASACADGRRAALLFGDEQRGSCDWALPSIFLPDRETRMDLASLAQAASRAGFANSFRDNRDPPAFCGRQLPLVELREAIRSGEKCLFLIHNDVRASSTFPVGSKFGKTWLLRELAALAASEGHLPVVLSWQRNIDEYPRSFDQLLGALVLTIQRLYDGLGLGVEPELQINALRCEAAGLSSATPLAAPVKTALGIHWGAGTKAVPDQAWRAAIQADLQSLRQKWGGGVQSTRVIVFVDDVECLQEAVRPFVKLLDSSFGLGRKDDPVPVVLAYSHVAKEEADKPAVQTLQALEEATRRRPISLGPFHDQADYYGVYCEWLLHLSEYWGPLVLNPEIGHRKKVIERLHRHIQGIPSNLQTRSMAGGMLYHVLDTYLEMGALQKAKDQDWIELERVQP